MKTKRAKNKKGETVEVLGKMHKWKDLKRATGREFPPLRKAERPTKEDLLAGLVDELERFSNAYMDRVEAFQRRVPTLHDGLVVAVVSRLASSSKETTVEEDVEYAFAYADAVLKEKTKREAQTQKLNGAVAACAAVAAAPMICVEALGKSERVK